MKQITKNEKTQNFTENDILKMLSELVKLLKTVKAGHNKNRALLEQLVQDIMRNNYVSYMGNYIPKDTQSRVIFNSPVNDQSKPTLKAEKK